MHKVRACTRMILNWATFGDWDHSQGSPRSILFASLRFKNNPRALRKQPWTARTVLERFGMMVPKSWFVSKDTFWAELGSNWAVGKGWWNRLRVADSHASGLPNDPQSNYKAYGMDSDPSGTLFLRFWVRSVRPRDTLLKCYQIIWKSWLQSSTAILYINIYGGFWSEHFVKTWIIYMKPVIWEGSWGGGFSRNIVAVSRDEFENLQKRYFQGI